MDELHNKVLNEKFNKLPNYVTADFQKIIKNCLNKREDKRPSIDEIIMSEVFQKKCRLLRITLPLMLNKEKLAQKEEKEQ